MTNPITQNAYLVANGTGTIYPTVIYARAPATSDFGFPITQRWIDTSDKNAEWFLLKFTSSNGVVNPDWVQLSSGGNTTETLTGNTGGAVGPDGSLNINVLGDSSGIQFAGNPGTNTLTATLANIPNSSLANSSITLVAGTGISISVSPVSLGGSTTISTTGAVALLFTADSGTATPSSGNLIITGSTTGLTTTGSGHTIGLTGTLGIANGGTNASSMSTSTGIVKYDGTRLVTSSAAKIDSSNRYTNTAQPCFQVFQTNDVSNVTGDGTTYNLLFDTTSFDQNSNITLNSGSKTIFTAPVTGKYLFSGVINFVWGAGGGSESVIYSMVDSNGNTYRLSEIATITTLSAWGQAFSFILAMTAADTVYLSAVVNGASGKNGIFRGLSGSIYLNYWSGALLD